MIKEAIAKQEKYNKAQIKKKLSRMLADLDILEQMRNCSVLIKPNCVGVLAPAEGRTTHPIVLEALAEILQGVGAKVTIGESSEVGADTWAAYQKTGIKKVAEKLGVELIDFKKSNYVEVSVDNPLAIKKILLPEEVLNADYLISLAKMKTNYVSRMSCSMKNMKGTLLDKQKRSFHRIGLQEGIVDLYSVINGLNCLAIIDGIVGTQLYQPRKLGALVASTDFIAADSVCAEIMGLNPREVKYLKIGYQRGLGEIDIKKMKILGPLFTVSPSFRSIPPGLRYMAKEFEVKIVDGNPCSSCIGGLYLGLKKIKLTRPELLKGLRIAVGDCKDIDNLSDTIRFGSCACQNRKDRLSVIGCCPTSADLIKVVREKNKKPCSK